ncbi:MAG TPA: lanthionine synthetase C family protein [Candidatus Angelobacter sp.]|jgi:lantibiotic modifying enzyme|nr:lanthionine synthetase C family protein [Candidatus Angelobacter sp.]
MPSHFNAVLSPWQPLLRNHEAQGVLQSLREIAELLQNPGPAEHGATDIDFQRQSFSLGSGSAGIAVFLAYLEKSGLGSGARPAAFEQMNRAIEVVASQFTFPGLYGGFTGVGWAAEHVTRLLAESQEDLNSDLDSAVEQYVQVSPWKEDYDLISGLVGLGIYCLERSASSGAGRALELIVERLYETAEHSKGEDIVTWFTPPSLLIPTQLEKYPQGFHNLGVAHGVPGVIALLGRTCSAGIAKDKASWLLDRAVAWLLRQRLPAGSNSMFASVIAPGPPMNDCRLAWCYGDAGIAAALLLAARCTGNSSWEAEALAIAQHSARRAPDQCGVTDACVCHGSAGLAHIFNRIYQATNDELCANAARLWLERTLAYREPGKGAAGYLIWGTDEQEKLELQSKLGLIQGIAGIGLVLLAAVSDVEPNWDRVFQTDIPRAELPPHD